MKKETTAVRLARIMSERRLKQVDVLRAAQPYAEEYHVKMNRSDISQYLSGKVEPGQDKLTVLGKALGVNPVWLMGIDVPMVETEINTEPQHPSLPNHPAILPITKRKIPLLGNVACGEPIYAEEDLSSYTLLDSHVECDFALRCQGDSMINARIFDGDLVFVKRQEYVDDGTIVVALIDDEATLKRIYHLGDGRVMLQAENPRYAPIIIGGEDETRTFRVLGKAVAFQSIIV